MGLNTYYEARACVSTEPSSSGNFLKLTDYVWGCSYARIIKYHVYKLLLHLGGAATCIAAEACSGIYKPDPSNEEICTCAAFIGPDGRSCLAGCSSNQDSVSTSDPNIRQCVCKCYLSLDRRSCGTTCGLHQKPIKDGPGERGHCACEAGYFRLEDGSACILQEQCQRI